MDGGLANKLENGHLRTKSLNFRPLAHIDYVTNELVISEDQAPNIKISKREWGVSDWCSYFFEEKKPEKTREILEYKKPIELKRVRGVNSFYIREEGDRHFIEYWHSNTSV